MQEKEKRKVEDWQSKDAAVSLSLNVRGPWNLLNKKVNVSLQDDSGF